MIARRRFVLLATLSLVATLLLHAGCGGNKHTVMGPGPTPPTYPILSSPQNVLAAMALAYQRRDSIETALVYDQAYQGSSIDQTDPALTPTFFYKYDEVAHLSALAKTTTIASVTCQLAPMLIRFTDGSDPPGWATIDNPIAAIEINSSPTSSSLSRTGIFMEFKFAPTSPDSTSPTDTTWKIVRWLEVKN